MNRNLDEITKQMMPNKQFITEYLELLIGKKSEYKYNVHWHYIDDEPQYHLWLNGAEFVKKYAGQIFVSAERGPYNSLQISKDQVKMVFANDYRMKQLYQEGVIGKIDWQYDDTLSPEEKLEYGTGKKADKWEWEDGES